MNKECLIFIQTLSVFTFLFSSLYSVGGHTAESVMCFEMITGKPAQDPLFTETIDFLNLIQDGHTYPILQVLPAARAENFVNSNLTPRNGVHYNNEDSFYLKNRGNSKISYDSRFMDHLIDTISAPAPGHLANNLSPINLLKLTDMLVNSRFTSGILDISYKRGTSEWEPFVLKRFAHRDLSHAAVQMVIAIPPTLGRTNGN